jgi:hypothetical protein
VQSIGSTEQPVGKPYDGTPFAPVPTKKTDVAPVLDYNPAVQHARTEVVQEKSEEKAEEKKKREFRAPGFAKKAGAMITPTIDYHSAVAEAHAHGVTAEVGLAEGLREDKLRHYEQRKSEETLVGSQHTAHDVQQRDGEGLTFSEASSRKSHEFQDEKVFEAERERLKQLLHHPEGNVEDAKAQEQTPSKKPSRWGKIGALGGLLTGASRAKEKAAHEAREQEAKAEREAQTAESHRTSTESARSVAGAGMDSFDRDRDFMLTHEQQLPSLLPSSKPSQSRRP